MIDSRLEMAALTPWQWPYEAYPVVLVPPRIRANRVGCYWKIADLVQLNSWLSEPHEHFALGIEDLDGFDKLILVQQGMGFSIAHVAWIDKDRGVGLAFFNGVGYLLEYAVPGFPERWMVVNRWTKEIEEE